MLGLGHRSRGERRGGRAPQERPGPLTKALGTRGRGRWGTACWCEGLAVGVSRLCETFIVKTRVWTDRAVLQAQGTAAAGGEASDRSWESGFGDGPGPRPWQRSERGGGEGPTGGAALGSGGEAGRRGPGPGGCGGEAGGRAVASPHPRRLAASRAPAQLHVPSLGGVVRAIPRVCHSTAKPRLRGTPQVGGLGVTCGESGHRCGPEGGERWAWGTQGSACRPFLPRSVQGRGGRPGREGALCPVGRLLLTRPPGGGDARRTLAASLAAAGSRPPARGATGAH